MENLDASHFKRLKGLAVKPLTPKSDKHLISPNNITPKSNIEFRRIREMIGKLKKLLIVRQVLPANAIENV